MIDLTPVVQAVISLAVALITAFLIPYLKKKMDSESHSKLATWVEVAVKAAEMIFNETGMGDKKKEYVIDFLAKKGFTLDTDDAKASVDTLIESIVNGLK